MADQSKRYRVMPIDSVHTTRLLKDKLGGNQPLPVIDMPGGMLMVPWAIPDDAIAAMSEAPHVLQLLLGPDGSMSMSVAPVELVKTQ